MAAVGTEPVAFVLLDDHCLERLLTWLSGNSISDLLHPKSVEAHLEENKMYLSKVFVVEACKYRATCLHGYGGFVYNTCT